MERVRRRCVEEASRAALSAAQSKPGGEGEDGRAEARLVGSLARKPPEGRREVDAAAAGDRLSSSIPSESVTGAVPQDAEKTTSSPG